MCMCMRMCMPTCTTTCRCSSCCAPVPTSTRGATAVRTAFEPKALRLRPASKADRLWRCCAVTTCPSPLDVALQTSSHAAQLIIAAAGPWSPATHRLFPPAARRRAVELLLLGHLIVRHNCFQLEAPDALLDAWLLILQLDVRRSRPSSR